MPTATARVGDTVIASSSTYHTVEGNVYFPPSSLSVPVATSATHSTCPWKGRASYYDVTVGGQTIRDAAWYYPAPKDKAAHIKDHIAFYTNKVNVSVA
ncbi:hypothetical protein Z517_06956 [Fonsecaea pedrosoi CBS 271.37]|uniref:DUF427 domain-containing protein n=1 Tax=Fonsecaea pedrosoi CBS 271.37 TaxID=1442368 RepID=A0A0D2DR57_9EURO|nr:uncharacterized protein Z517_06956 [Fonsecaea pedrosoi CBS 271.37]KIW80341.1 hypothetical protein Z517_06956 [Fonsecaea pedrosoi CBS 271.37]